MPSYKLSNLLDTSYQSPHKPREGTTELGRRLESLAILKMSSALSQMCLSRSGVYSMRACYLGRHCVSLPSTSKMIRKEISTMLVQSTGCGEATLSWSTGWVPRDHAAMDWVGSQPGPAPCYPPLECELSSSREKIIAKKEKEKTKGFL